MAKVYQHDAQGYYVGAVEDYGGPMPHNSVKDAPKVVAGYIPRWTGDAWEQVESHVGKSGFVEGVRIDIKKHGPLPDGWSEEYVDPRSHEEIRIEEIEGELSRLDDSAARPLNTVISKLAAGESVDPTDDDAVLLKHIEVAKENLREERRMLVNAGAGQGDA